MINALARSCDGDTLAALALAEAAGQWPFQYVCTGKTMLQSQTREIYNTRCGEAPSLLRRGSSRSASAGASGTTVAAGDAGIAVGPLGEALMPLAADVAHDGAGAARAHRHRNDASHDSQGGREEERLQLAADHLVKQQYLFFSFDQPVRHCADSSLQSKGSAASSSASASSTALFWASAPRNAGRGAAASAAANSASGALAGAAPAALAGAAQAAVAAAAARSTNSAPATF
eukprot:CAMPEP_0175224262 /NCGR_PEP_ID=MMETSP0093-20121207/21757_1 /TAXON_ID=311494 /ORGANISM="Alexandrium monilatum, Strain CCMP3105" /LENGTH=231 /DNA_ID=CAMNT_0016517891 /DNA_START=42 /DNA_END=736 /DNA_ORIENTATION=-